MAPTELDVRSTLLPPEQALLRHHDALLAGLGEVGRAARELGDLTAVGVRDRVDATLTYLRDDVLRRAHAEDVAVLPLLERISRDGGPSPSRLHTEHDTVRVATAELQRLGGRTLTWQAVSDLAGLLDGIYVMLDTHFSHESGTYTSLLEHLDAHERAGFLSQLAGLGELRHPAWLPDLVPGETTRGSADLLEPEGLVGASCDPHTLALVRSAIAADRAGVGADEWHTTVRASSHYSRYLDQARECMRASGLWPWAAGGPG